MSYSQIQVIGNLGGDPELRYLPSGTGVCNFSMAENRTYTKDGNRVTETLWYRVSCWGKLGETVNQHLSKGRQVLVVGQLQHEEGSPRIWGDPPRATFEIRADRVVFLGGEAPRKVSAEQARLTDNEEIPW